MKMVHLLILALAMQLLFASSSLAHEPLSSNSGVVPSFSTSGDFFVKDGEPFIITSGEIHYWRVLPADWETRLAAVAGMGYNTITVYVNWALHEPQPGQFDFSGRNNVTAFIQLAWEKFGLYCICRVGPCIVAETENGGFPYWLSLVEPPMQLRSMNATYLEYVDRYFAQLFPLLVPLQYNTYGGPIILFQAEDDTTTSVISVEEDQQYHEWVVQALRRYNLTALANTLCFPLLGECERAHVEGAILAAEFPYYVPPSAAFDIIRIFMPTGPLIVMETYSGWECCCLEGHEYKTIDAQTFSSHVDNILQTRNASVSIYMAYGGTNYGFSNGALHPWDLGPIQFTRWAADVTSYDYDAPIHEAGQMDDKYTALREVFLKYNPKAPPMPAQPAIAAYGAFDLNEYVPLFEAAFPSIQSVYPLGMEQLHQAYGYVLYTTKLQSTQPANSVLSISGVMQDRALVYLDGVLSCILGWSEEGAPLNCTLKSATESGTVVSILVENKGRVNEEIIDFEWARKGIYGNVTIGSELLHNWNITSLPIEGMPISSLPFQSVSSTPQVPAFYRGTFQVSGDLIQTFLLTPNWGHGVVLVNGFNLGRFSLLGPQCSLFVPASVLVAGTNEVIVFESDSPPPGTNTVRQMISTEKQMWFNSDKVCAEVEFKLA